jgi:peroxiredoxin Q/BCP
MLKRGDIAPDFAFGGRTLYQMLDEQTMVVFFFPKAFTPGCAREAGAFGREFENLRKTGCEVVGVSHDTQEVNDRFRTSLGLPYPLVGDPEGTILRDYKVRWPMLGLAQRVTYVVGRDRRVRLAFHSEFDMDAHASQACQMMQKAEA